MRPGNHSAQDGSFGRSAGGALGRGVALLAVALVIGIVLLNATEADAPGTRVGTGQSRSGDSDEGDARPARRNATTSTAPTTTVLTRPPGEVKVIVANASGVKGAAGRASEVLKPRGYNVLAPTNARNTESSVFFAAGYEREAAAIAVLLGLPPATVKPLPTPPPIADSKDANVVVFLGTDHGSRFGAPAGTTSTTAAGAATTTTAKAP